MDLSNGVRVTLRQPQPPRVTVQAPPNVRGVVVPIRGPQGPPGNAGSAYTHTQTNPASQWNVVHNLHIHPLPVVLLDSAPDTPVTTDVTYVDDTAFILTFPAPVTGVVHIH